MDRITHPVYRDYPEQPYISKDRDLEAWVRTPERFPYSRVSRANMVRTEEGLLPGHIVMLWLVDVSNITNEFIAPQYFEYRYGVEAEESKQVLAEKGYAVIGDAADSLPLLNADTIKRLLKQKSLPLSGKKEELLRRALENFNDKELANFTSLRRYRITPEGKEVLNRHLDIIERHGMKKQAGGAYMF